MLIAPTDANKHGKDNPVNVTMADAFGRGASPTTWVNAKAPITDAKTKTLPTASRWYVWEFKRLFSAASANTQHEHKVINENASEPNKFDQCVNVSTVVKSGNCSASLKSKNVVNVSGVLNKFARLIGSSAMPESRNAFVSLFSSLLSFDDDEDDDDDDDAIALIVLLVVIIFLAKPGGHRRDEDDAFLFVANPF